MTVFDQPNVWIYLYAPARAKDDLIFRHILSSRTESVAAVAVMLRQ